MDSELNSSHGLARVVIELVYYEKVGGILILKSISLLTGFECIVVSSSGGDLSTPPILI